MSDPTPQSDYPQGPEFQTIPQQPDPKEMPLPAARSDIQISPQLYLGKTVYVAKDPISLNYFRLQPAEHFIFKRMDGSHSAGQLAEMVNTRFPQQQTTPEEILHFVKMLQGGALLLGRGESHGKFLRKMRDQRRAKKRTATLLSFMFIKVPVLDPDALLDVIYSFVKPFMGRAFMWLSIIFCLVSGAAVGMELYRVENLAFPLLGWQNLLLLSTVFMAVKVIHEFGHGLAAKHRGLEVHEMGVMFMVFLPLFYVDVSDAWMVPRKRDRMWITAGGVFIEMLFASIAAWVWLNTSPGVANQVAFNVMLAASVTTLLFNANPLLRYDGYYFLMDWLEIPNLRSKAMGYLSYLSKRYLLGISEAFPPREAAGKPIFMPIYAVAAGIYRWVVVFGIITLVWHILDPYGLEVVGSVLGFFALATMVGMPILKLVRFVWSHQVKNWRRAMVALGGTAGLLIVACGILAIPLEDAVEHPATLIASERQPVYINATGLVEKVFVTDGGHIGQDEPILQIRDDDLRDRLAAMRIELKRLRHQQELAIKKGQQVSLVSYKDLINDTEGRIEFIESKVEELIVRAPIAGRLSSIQNLTRMIGMKVNQGDELGYMIGDGPRLIAMVLPQADKSAVTAGKNARVRLWGSSQHVLTGKVWRVGNQFINELPHEALSGKYEGEVDILPSDSYKSAPSEPSVVAEITLDDDQKTSMSDGMTGRAKVILDDSTLGGQQWRLIRKTLSLDWWL